MKLKKFNVAVTNGVIHVIDGVMIPPEGTAAQYLNNTPELYVLSQALSQANIQQQFDGKVTQTSIAL